MNQTVALMLKYAAGAALLGSVFALVLLKLETPDVFLGLVTLAMGALGVHAATNPKE